MEKRCCESCVYATRLWGRWLRIIMRAWSGLRVCFNSVDNPGRMQEVYPTGSCRNFRPRPSPPILAKLPEPPDDSIRYIPLTQGQFAIVDAEDYDRVSRHKWCVSRNGAKLYARRTSRNKCILMHRFIMKPPKGKVVNHIDGNGLNNRRSNLRICTPRENTRNKPGRGELTGICFRKQNRKYYAQVVRDGKSYFAGPFDYPMEAARARDRLALEIHREYAWLNFPDEWPPERRQAVYAEAKAAGRKLRRDAKTQGRHAKEKTIHHEGHTKT